MTSCNRIFVISGAQLPVTMFSVSPKDDHSLRTANVYNQCNIMALESHPTPLTVKQRSFFACKRGDAGASIQSAIGYVDCEFQCIDTATESHALCKKHPQIIYISINDV